MFESPGRYGAFGGQYVASGLLPVLDRLERAFLQIGGDQAFKIDLVKLLTNHVGRPTPLMPISRASSGGRGAQVYLKREDLSNCGGNYSNSAAGQCLLARQMGYKAVVTDTGSGDQGVATASVAAKLGLACTIYMAESHRRSQDAMVRRMIAFGAEIRAVPGDGTLLHHAMSAAIQHWMGAADSCMYVAGGPVGPHPYPAMIHQFQGVIGHEVADQCNLAFGSLPSVAVAALGGGSSAIGLFARFLDEPVKLVVAEAGGSSSDFGSHSASLSYGKPGILHGAQTIVLQDGDGQITRGSSIASGLTYPGVGPELAHLYTSGRVQADVVSNDAAIGALRFLAEVEGIIVSLEAAHAVASAFQQSDPLPETYAVVCVVNSAGSQDDQHLAVLSR